MEFDNTNTNGTNGDISMESQGLNSTPGLLRKATQTEEDRIQELIVLKNNALTKKLEIISVILAVAMAIFYNMMPIVVTLRVKNQNITDNESFYSNEEVMRAWSAYLIINVVIQVAVCAILCIITV